jgi:single-stranded-DNA-specific exonuclease
MSNQRIWRLFPELPVPNDLLPFVGSHPSILQMLARRGILSAQAAQAFLDPNHYHPTPPAALPGLQAAADRLEVSIQSGEKICVWGDFDVDGQTATTILVSALRNLGAQVRYYIPIRLQESHGISLSALKKQIELGLDLLLTCDTGIAAHQAIQEAARSGVETIITDHHELPSLLPNAFAIINPKLLEEPNHPLASLPGAGVAYKLAEELYARRGKSAEISEFHDLVALGIVADVASLVAESRFLLQLGLRRLQATERVGLRALMEIANVKPALLTEETIAFVLAPRLNALGRLSDANPIVEFFSTTDAGFARIQAQLIESLNAQRKLLTDQVFKAAIAQVDRQPSLLDTHALVLNYPSWPAGVIGIIASRLVEYFHKPVVLISSPSGEIARGSARSIPQIDITRAIASQASLLEGFGGHPMAAGLSIHPERIDEFRQGLSRFISQHLPADVESVLEFDAVLPFKALNLELVKQFEQLAPFGAGNPAPVLVAPDLTVQSCRAIGNQEEHLLVQVVDSEMNSQEVIWWQGAGFSLPEGMFDLAYSVHSRDFKGQPAIQVVWLESRPAQAPRVILKTEKPTRRFVDHRQEVSPIAILQNLISQPGVQIWREGPADRGGNLDHLSFGSDRFHLSPTPTLVIWTIPPGRNELAAVIERTQSDTIYFFADHPGLDQLNPFIKHLAGLVKYALNQPEQPTKLSSLACNLAHRISTVRFGLDWLEARGSIQVQSVGNDLVVFQPSQNPPSPNIKEVEHRLHQALVETVAFRSFYLRLDLSALVNG